jgi:hypothetical protein
VDLESVKQFNLDKMEQNRRKAEQDRLDEKVIELQRAAEAADGVDLETRQAIDSAAQDVENSDNMFYSSPVNFDNTNPDLKDVSETGAIDKLKGALGMETENDEPEVQTDNGSYEKLLDKIK